MIYMIADDPAGGALLDQQANRELDQIVHGALSVNRGQLHVAVQLDFRSQPDVWRRVVGEGAWLQPESDAADPETLYGFFEWAQRMCPADRYALILWGHSRGPFGLFTDAPFSSALSGLFAKADPWTYVAQTLTLKELRAALRHARECLNQEVDIIAFKDCFMSTLETAYELKDAATYLIGSPDIVPIEGWPYARMFEQLARQPEAKLAAKALVKEIEQYYRVAANRHGRSDVPFTLMDTSKLSDVSEPLRVISTKLAAETARGNGGEPFRKALTASTKADPALVDVNTLCRRIKRHGLKQPAEHLETALATMTLSDDGARGRASVSLFCFPFAKKDQKESIVAHHATRPVYSELAIVKTGWDGVALQAMPHVEPTAPASHHHDHEGKSSEYMTSGGLLPVLLEQLQRQGVLEDLGRKGLDVLRRVLANLAQDTALGRQGFDAESLKESGFAKESGFVAEMLDKESGFAAPVLGPAGRPQPARRPEAAVTHAARTRKKRKR
jgi:cysteine peptidase C11 family protein